MSWNEGLRIWTIRRDSWTGAIAHKPRRKLDDSAHPLNQSKDRFASDDRHEHDGHDATGRSSHLAPKSQLSTPQPASNPTSPIEEPGTHADAEFLPDEPYLPIYPPLFPASHALRSRIKPTAYPTIYSKVVIQSLAPNIPIPLNHMVNALVEGWKSEGNWPPRAMALEQPVGRRKARKGESAFSKWKREQDGRRKDAMSRAKAVEYEQEENHRGVRSQISGAVKKLLGGGEEANVDRELEQMGLTFETDEERLNVLHSVNHEKLK